MAVRDSSTRKLCWLLALTLSATLPKSLRIEAAHAANPAEGAGALTSVYVTQSGPSACSLAGVTMVINALRRAEGRPAVSQRAVLSAANDPHWVAEIVADGEGVTFAELRRLLQQSLEAFGYGDAVIRSYQPNADDGHALGELRAFLADGDGLVLAAFDQGVLIGDAGAGHVSPLGQYDPAKHRILVLDVDRQLPGPYWASDAALFAALIRPDPTDPTGNGLLKVIPPPVQARRSAAPR